MSELSQSFDIESAETLQSVSARAPILRPSVTSKRSRMGVTFSVFLALQRKLRLTGYDVTGMS